MEGEGRSLTVEAFQAPWEFEQLKKIVPAEPRRTLEIGAMYGGTLGYWLHIAREVVVVDDEMRGADIWHDWAESCKASLRLVKGRSQDERVVEAVRAFGPYDFAFIDADHSYQAVKADWENYGPLADVVAFHDILPRDHYGVSYLWDELKNQPGARYMEICQNEVLPGNEGRCGIGILWRT